jgi:hypothetical protein
LDTHVIRVFPISCLPWGQVFADFVASHYRLSKAGVRMSRPQQDPLQAKFDAFYEQAHEDYTKQLFPEAEQALLKARQTALEQGKNGRYNLAAALNLLSAVHADSGRMSKAAELSLQAYQLLAEEATEDNEDLFGVACNAARFHILSGKTDEGKRLFKKARFHAKAQGQPMMAALSYLNEARSFQVTGSPTREITMLVDQAIAGLREDTHGDFLYEGVGGGAALLYELGEKERAIELLREALVLQDQIYRQPVPAELTKNPAWVLDLSLARTIVFRENYQEEGVDPIPMNELRLLLADMLMEQGQLNEAIVEYERLDQQFKLEEQRSKSGDSDDDDDEIFDEDNDLGEEEDEEESDDDADDDDEFDDDLEDDDIESHYVDRAQFYANYASALHLKGREEGSVKLLHRARELYDAAESYALLGEENHEDQEEFMEELLGNIRDLEKDIEQA